MILALSIFSMVALAQGRNNQAQYTIEPLVVSEAPAAVVTDTTTEGESDYGAISALLQEDLTIEEMLRYAIEDEYLARQEYESIMDQYGEQRPFSNIIKAEETHIAMLTELYDTYNYEMPVDTALDHVYVPASIAEALAIGVQAEIDNIAMYNHFLEQELPEDIRIAFISLRDASESHLAAFERGTTPNGGGRGAGR